MGYILRKIPKKSSLFFRNRNGLDLAQHILRQGLNGDAATSGSGGKVAGIDLIESGKIIHNREDYIEQKGELMELYDERDYDNLEIRLRPLIRSMRTGVNLGYTYSVDSDIDR